jgi:membrane dipeptidase
MTLIVDSHLDLAYNAIEFNRDLRQPVAAIRQSEADMDGKGRGSNTVSLHALREGNIGLCFATVHSRVESMDGQFPGVRTQDIAYAKAQGELAFYRVLEQQGLMRMIRDVDGLNAHLAEWQADPEKAPIGFVLSMEGADPIMSPEQVPDWWEQGLRTVSLVHYGVSTYAHGTQAPGGLLPAAKLLLRAIEEQGIILDASHMADGTFWESLDVYGGPLIATHNCCRTLVPHDRQFTDEQIAAIAERKGVIGVAFDAWMLSPGWDKSNPDNSRTTLCTVVDHIDHICQVTGSAAHAAIGTDLDGGYGREQSPCDLDTIADLQKIPDILQSRGYVTDDVNGIMHGNWIDLLRRVWQN